MTATTRNASIDFQPRMSAAMVGDSAGVRSAYAAGHKVIGLAIVTVEDYDGYDAAETDAALSALAGVPCGIYGDGEDHPDGFLAPVIAR
jgi:hypothetical protein